MIVIFIFFEVAANFVHLWLAKSIWYKNQFNQHIKKDIIFFKYSVN